MMILKYKGSTIYQTRNNFKQLFFMLKVLREQYRKESRSLTLKVKRTT